MSFGKFNANPFGTAVEEPKTASKSAEEEEETDTFDAGATSFGGFGGPFGGGDASGEGAPSSFPSNYGMNRRTSVSAESLNPTASSNDNWTPPVHHKTPDQLERLQKAVSGHTLFQHLDDEQSSQIIGALVEKTIPAKDIKVCDFSSLPSFFQSQCYICNRHKNG